MNKNLKFKGPMKDYLRWPFYLVVLLLAINSLVYLVNIKAGVVLSLGILVYLGFAIVMSLRLRPQIQNELNAYASQYASVEQQMLSHLEVPFAVLNDQGRFVWANPALQTLAGKADLYNKPLSHLFPNLDLKKLRDAVVEKEENHNADPVLQELDGRVYRLSLQPLSLQDPVFHSRILEDVSAPEKLRSLYLFDETQLLDYARHMEEDKLCVALIYLDNYEEAMESVEDVRRSLLFALIDRHIAKYFADFDGVVHKLEKDKYFLIFQKTALDQLRDRRFDILEEVKTVNIGNQMPVTLSIGVGLNGSSLRQNNEYARIAMEMALGRGGDQAVVKDGDSITYWGGKSLQVEKNTRVKARMKAQALKEFIAAKDRVVVMGHKITDVDALGAAIGLYRAGQTLEKPVHIVVNDPTTSIRPLMDGFLDNPEYNADMFVDSAHAKELVDNNTVVIVVDTNKPSYTECQDLLSLTKTVVVLDHHRRGNEIIENAVLSYVEPYASSTCEMVAEILQYFSDDLKLRSLEADCLYAGIVIDTNNFITRSGVRTFEAAAYLRRNGADTTKVRKMLRDNFESYKAKAEAVRNAEIYREFFAIAQCPGEGLESPTVVGAQAANELLNIAEVKASFVMTRYNNEIYVSARAIDEVNVQLLMEQLGGGGHLNVAGAQVKTSMDDARQMLKRIIDNYMDEEGLKK